MTQNQIPPEINVALELIQNTTFNATFISNGGTRYNTISETRLDIIQYQKKLRLYKQKTLFVKAKKLQLLSKI